MLKFNERGASRRGIGEKIVEDKASHGPGIMVADYDIRLFPHFRDGIADGYREIGLT